LRVLDPCKAKVTDLRNGKGKGRAEKDEGHLEVTVFVHKNITGFLFMCQDSAANVKVIKGIQDHDGQHPQNVHILDHATESRKVRKEWIQVDEIVTHQNLV